MTKTTPVLPQTITGHTVLAKLGQGATAEVFSARRDLDGSLVALKVLHAGLAQHEDVCRRMLAEVETAALLKHPHIVEVYGLVSEKNPPAFSMEFIDGPSLADYQCRLPYILPEVSVLIMIDVLAGLEHAHSQGIIHRDLKPSNILISPKGCALITDFGLARITEAPTITMTGTILGSPDYMSPEQARGDVLSPRSDLFSAAAVLYFLLTGTRPFGKPSPLATLVAVSNAEFEPVQKRNPKVSAALSRLINKGLSKNPDQRFASAAEFKKALESYLKETGINAPLISLAQWMAAPSETTMNALKVVAESLYRRCELELSVGDRDAAFETIAHLSLVAPDSAALVALMEKIEHTPDPAAIASPRPYHKRAAVALIGVAALLTLIVVALPQLAPATPATPPLLTTTATATTTTPAILAPATTAASAPVSAVEKTQEPPNTSMARPSPKVSKNETPTRGLLRFHVPKGVRVAVDGKDIDPFAPLRLKPGVHKLMLEKPGYPPIVQLIKVDSREPTDIRVN